MLILYVQAIAFLVIYFVCILRMLFLMYLKQRESCLIVCVAFRIE